MTAEYDSLRHQEQLAQWEAHEYAAVTEAARLRGALEERGLRREQNIVGIEAKLTGGELSPRKQSRLMHELDLLRTYDTRHLVGETAVHKHIWIKFGLNYEAVMSH